MKKSVAVLLFLLSIGSLWCQNRNPLEYTKFFDAYYRKGPLKFAFDPGISILNGDLKKSNISFNIGASVNYKIWAPVDAVVGLKYFNLVASDSGLTTSGSHLQLNLQGRYYLRYDRIRTNYDRRRDPKVWKLYLVSGLSITRSSVTSSMGSSGGYRFNIPIGLGIPFRLSDRVSLIPEVSFFYTFTDNIDALAITSPTDQYFLASLSLEFNPKGKRRKNNMRKRGKAAEEADMLDEGGSGNGGSKSEPADDGEEISTPDAPEDKPDSDDDNGTEEETIPEPENEETEPLDDGGDSDSPEDEGTEETETDEWGEGDDSGGEETEDPEPW